MAHAKLENSWVENMISKCATLRGRTEENKTTDAKHSFIQFNRSHLPMTWIHFWQASLDKLR